jgi:predicted HAD superfamily Cof-like phosphohydrolase/BMFP domain-containing protein YqiC
MSEKREAVDHPSHYGGADNPHEVIKCLQAWGLEKDALVWNAGKYIARAHLKGEPVESYQKACWYLLRRVALLEGKDPSFYNDMIKVSRSMGAVRVKLGRPPGNVGAELKAVAEFGGTSTELKQKQHDRGYSDGRAGHSPSLLSGPYSKGYSDGRGRNFRHTYLPEPTDEEVKASLESKRELVCGQWVGSHGGLELSTQIDKLANWIMDNVPGEPSQSEGAVDTAIRIMDSFQHSDLDMQHREEIHKLEQQLVAARAEGNRASLRETGQAKDYVLVKAAEICQEIYGAHSSAAKKILALGSDMLKGKPVRARMASVCEAGMCDHRKFGNPCPELTEEEYQAQKPKAKWPEGVAVEEVQGRVGRCGRCLIKVPKTTFLHDCAGKGLGIDHYVSQLENEVDRLGRIPAQTEHQGRVENMMRGFGQNVPPRPALPDEDTRVLRARLILEEALETIQDGLRVEVNLGWIGSHPDTGRPTSCAHTVEFDRLKFKAQEGEADLIELADGVADISVVSIGTLSACGIKDRPLLEEVDANNQAKIDTGRRDEHGKWIKSPNHQPPDIAGVLKEQGWCADHKKVLVECQGSHPF